MAGATEKEKKVFAAIAEVMEMCANRQERLVVKDATFSIRFGTQSYVESFDPVQLKADLLQKLSDFRLHS